MDKKETANEESQEPTCDSHLSKILVVNKLTKYEYEREKFGLDHEGICRKYQSEHANLGAILKSHDEQLQARLKFGELLTSKSICFDTVMMGEVKQEIKGYDLVASFGGDNSFSYLSHFVEDIPIMGINSDPTRSVGALCLWSAAELEDIVSKIYNQDFTINGWTRLSALIDSKQISGATSEYFFGEKMRKEMSREILEYRGKSYELKGSGLLIVTGAGSTGWFESAGRYIFPNGARFPKTEKKAVFLSTEPYLYKGNANTINTGEIMEGEEIVIHSLNDGHGYASSDSWEEYDFMRGNTAVVKIDEKPLRVVSPNTGDTEKFK